MKKFLCVLAVLLSLTLVVNAHAFWGFSKTSSAIGSGSWSSWDETTEAGLSNDQNGDGTEDTFIVFFEGATGTHETGVGVLTGADSGVTQSGNVSGTTSTPPSRYIDSIDDDFTMTESGMSEFCASGQQFICIWKVYNMVSGNTAWGSYSSDSSGDYFGWKHGPEHNIYFAASDGAGGLGDTTTVNVPSNDSFYIYMLFDGTNVRGAHTASKETDWNNIATGRKVSNAHALFLEGFDAQASPVYNDAGNGLSYFINYFIMSKVPSSFLSNL